MTLTEFLLARIEEDEATARAASVLAQGVDRISTHSLPEFAEHMTTWQPNRVAAECEAKRRIVERCSAVGYAMPATHLAHGILAELALPHAEHPDYREEWKP
jgi:hypothetical protein